MNEEGGGQTLTVKPGDFVVNGSECGQVVEIDDVFVDVVKLKGHQEAWRVSHMTND